MSFNAKAQLLKTLLSNYCIWNVKLNQEKRETKSSKEAWQPKNTLFFLLQLDFMMMLALNCTLHISIKCNWLTFLRYFLTVSIEPYKLAEHRKKIIFSEIAKKQVIRIAITVCSTEQKLRILLLVWVSWNSSIVYSELNYNLADFQTTRSIQRVKRKNQWEYSIQPHQPECKELQIIIDDISGRVTKKHRSILQLLCSKCKRGKENRRIKTAQRSKLFNLFFLLSFLIYREQKSTSISVTVSFYCKQKLFAFASF